ncbi:MAG: cell envelope integrity protein TolA [Candidatus Porifericomitaceae bacterium WSBS_2022_MAG_OTU9]
MRRESYWLYLTPALLSLLVHTIFSVPVFFNLQSAVKLRPEQKFSALEAVSIEAKAVEQELQRLRDIDLQKEQLLSDKVAAAEAATKAAEMAAEQARQRSKQQEALQQKQQKELQQLTAQRKLEEQKKLKAETERKVEEQKKLKVETERKAEEQKKLKAETERKAEEQKKLKAETERKAEEQKKLKAETERKAEEQKKLKAEAERKAEEQKKLKAEAARKAEEEKRQKEDAARKAEEQQRQKEEEARKSKLQQARDQRLLAALVEEIKNRTTSNFNLTGLPEGLSCKLEISLSPSGEVLGVIVKGSSGNELFDRRAELAVKKASPLPVPDDPRDFARLGFGKNSFIFEP